jgi:hypothetical protein
MYGYLLVVRAKMHRCPRVALPVHWCGQVQLSIATTARQPAAPVNWQGNSHHTHTSEMISKASMPTRPTSSRPSLTSSRILHPLILLGPGVLAPLASYISGHHPSPFHASHGISSVVRLYTLTSISLRFPLSPLSSTNLISLFLPSGEEARRVSHGTVPPEGKTSEPRERYR